MSGTSFILAMLFFLQRDLPLSCANHTPRLPHSSPLAKYRVKEEDMRKK